MKSNVLRVVLTLLMGCVLTGPVPALADNYLGDAAIYSAQGTTGFKPNVLIIIDNSKATENIASGVPYDKNTTYPNQGYAPWSIYVGDNQGNFNNVDVANADNTLANLTCSVTIVKETLLANGTYSGSGIDAFPNLNNGACATGPKGATYALGNYLNYVNASPSTADDVLVSHDYTYSVKIKGKWETVTESRKFVLTATHVSSADTEPATGANWGSYWNMLPSTETRAALPWTDATSYSLAAIFVGETQRRIVYEALANVIGGARYAVNFAAMSYGDNNSGGKILNHMADLEDQTAFETFLARLPGSGDATSEPVLSSQTGRPQAEALYDAGYYFGATYTPVSLATDTRVPASLAKSCYNNIIFVTNGLSNGDGGSASTVWTIGDADADGWPGEASNSAAVYGAGSHYLDDVAQHLQDIYDIKTHMVLAFQGADSLVQSAAISGDGKFYNVYDANSLSKAMTELLTNIVAEVNSAFVAPVVPTSPENRTYSGQRVYLGFFKPISQKVWQGNLKKFGINSLNQIVDRNGAIATGANGGFVETASSWWNTVTDAGEVDQGGAGLVLKERSVARNIYTYNATSSTKDLTSTDHRFAAGSAWLTTELTVADATERDKLINFIHGLDAYDDDGDGVTLLEKRDWIMGDILHSKPKIINYNTYDFNATSEANYNWSDTNPYNKTVIYVGANDGMLHAFRDADGAELWSFIPPDILPNLKSLREASHSTFVDGTPTAYIYDHDDDGNIETGDGDKVILLFGLRRGGNAYYALDVSNPLVPTFLWKIDSSTSGFGEMGESWSTPTLAKVKVDVAGTPVDKIVAFVGAGYDNDNEDGRFGNTLGFTDADVVIPTDDAGPTAKTSAGTTVLARDGSSSPLSNAPKGRGVYAFEVATLNASGVPTIPTSPVKVWDFTYSNTGTDTLSYNRKRLMYSIPSDVTAFDTDYDGYVDRLYVGDTGGQLWRISAYYPDTESDTTKRYRPYARAVINTTGDPWFGKRIFEANTATTNTTDKGRKIFFRPSITVETGGIYRLYLGTGDRAHPLNTAVVDRMYGLIDRGQITSELIDEDNLVDVTENLLQADTPPANPETCSSGDNSIKCILERLNSPSSYGWYIKLENSGEKALATPLAFNKVAYYTTYAPVATTTNSCTPGNLGVSRLYAVDYKTGEAVLNFASATSGVNNDSQSTSDNKRALSKDGKVLRKADRSIQLGVGIPSGLVVLMPPSGDAKLLIGCGGGLCSEDPVMGGTIIPIYWMQW